MRDDLWEVSDQEFSSAATSINKGKTAQTFTLVEARFGWTPKSSNLDLGGGKFDNATDFLKKRGVKNYIFDPYNRTKNHNESVVSQLKKEKFDSVTINNVLNVIKEPENREKVLQQAIDALKPEGKLYISVYEGDKSGNGRQTSEDGYQLNRKAEDYMDEVKKYFPDAIRKYGLIMASAPKLDNDNKHNSKVTKKRNNMTI